VVDDTAGVDDRQTRHLLNTLLSAAVTASFVSLREAAAHAERAHAVARALDDPLGLARALQHRSDCAFELGDLELARRTGEEALQVAEGLGGYALARCRLTVAYNHLAALDLEAAGHWIQQAHTAFQAIDDVQGVADADLARAVLAVLTGSGASAIDLLEQVLTVIGRPTPRGRGPERGPVGPGPE
jgi:tetratricopeptide (TPR) repeat protein